MGVKPRAILLVEDHEADEQLTLRSLRKGNIANEILVARDGEQALSALLGRPAAGIAPGAELPQVVLLDLKLPKVDGIEVLRAIRADPRTRLLPVVVLTSSDEERDIMESYELGVNSYVRKPVAFEEFVEAVTRVGLYWTVTNTSPVYPPKAE